jgi:hypothetical protein
MRLFVNVYHPSSTNVVHTNRHEAQRSAVRALVKDTVEIEYHGSVDAAQRELMDVSAEWLRVHYPINPAVPTYSQQMPSAHPLQLQADIKAADAVTVGDLNSSARGTGARKSAGKPDWSQIPWWVFPAIFKAWKENKVMNSSAGIHRVIELMAEWQRGKNESLDLAAATLLEIIYAPAGRLGSKETLEGGWFPGRALASTAAVLTFGAKKYKPGNWAKGMPWSVCFTCTMSHLLKAFQGEEKDEESGLPHLAHAMCNMLFLLAYRDHYPEGDDRMVEFRPIVTAELVHD